MTLRPSELLNRRLEITEPINFEQAVELSRDYLLEYQRTSMLETFRAMEAVSRKKRIEISMPHIKSVYAHGSIVSGDLINGYAGDTRKQLLRGADSQVKNDSIDMVLVGAGKMGKQMMQLMAERGCHITVADTSKEITDELTQLLSNDRQDIKEYVDIYDSSTHALEAINRKYATDQIKKPKVIMLMVPAGKPEEKAIEELINSGLVGKNDVIINGGNTYYGNSLLTYEKFEKEGIHYMGVGVSGGALGLGNTQKDAVMGARYGACIMADGHDEYALKWGSAMLAALSKDGKFAVVGKRGAAHLTKGYHNAIEYAVMDAIGNMAKTFIDDLCWKEDEFFELLQKLQQTNTRCYLLDTAVEAYRRGFKDTPDGKIGGQTFAEMNTLTNDAYEVGSPIELTSAAVQYRRLNEDYMEYRGKTKAKWIGYQRRIFGLHDSTTVLKL